MRKLILIPFLSLLFTVHTVNAQNTPALWKHSCNCGAMEMMLLDTNQNVYIFNDGSNSNGISSMIKLSPSGGQYFNNTYLPVGYTAMQFNNSIYKNGNIYIAANVSNASQSQYNHLCLLKIDTLGNLINQLVIDTVETTRLIGIKSQPFYSYGLHIDQSNNIHTSFIKVNAGLSIYSFLKFDSNFNLIAQFHDTLGFSAYPGPCYYLPNGTVYYAGPGSISKLNFNYASKMWTAPLYSPFADPQMIHVENGEVFVLTKQLSGVPDPVNVLTRILDAGVIYINSYDTITAEGPNLYFTQMLVDLSNNSVYLAGNNSNLPPTKRYVNKHNSMDGSIVWRDSSFTGGMIQDLLLSPQKNVIAVGGGNNFNVWFYNAQGTINNTFVYDGPCGSNDGIAAARLDAFNRLIVTGSSCENNNTINYGTTLKYNIPIITTGSSEAQVSLPISISPVPAATEIYLSGGENLHSIAAIDVTGRSFELTMDGDNRIDISMIPAGIYQLVAHGDKHVYKGKLLVTR
ncbi:MAG: hypothetical protein IPN36_01945 [Bacteroidetes bacterium]|nr:hypothetical protein [Bacteroidota bacterium]